MIFSFRVIALLSSSCGYVKGSNPTVRTIGELDLFRSISSLQMVELGMVHHITFVPEPKLSPVP